MEEYLHSAEYMQSVKNLHSNGVEHGYMLG